MRRCPVCGRENRQLLCGGCGFDGSCDYERYPTLGNLNGRVDAVSRRKAARQAAEAGTLSCPNCGGKQFSVDFEKQTYRCGGCGHLIGVNIAKEIKKDFGYEHTAGSHSDSKKENKSSSKLKTGLSQAKDSTRKKWSRFDGFEKTVFLLGWATLLILMYSLWECVPINDNLTVFVTIILIITGLMQCRLWKHGFRERTRNGLLSVLAMILCRVFLFAAGICAIAALNEVIGKTDAGQGSFSILMRISVSCLYYGLWMLPRV